jgi:hypothetical protein
MLETIVLNDGVKGERTCGGKNLPLEICQTEKQGQKMYTTQKNCAGFKAPSPVQKLHLTFRAQQYCVGGFVFF